MSFKIYGLLAFIIVVATIVGYKTNSKVFLPLFLTAIITIIGWFIAHQLSSERNRINKHRDIRLEYLISAYLSLADASLRPPAPNSPYFQKMESAIADIQLFGSESQIEQVKAFLQEYDTKGKGSLDPLMNSLRNDLRKELKLSQIKENVHWFRPEGAPTGIEQEKKE